MVMKNPNLEANETTPRRGRGGYVEIDSIHFKCEVNFYVVSLFSTPSEASRLVDVNKNTYYHLSYSQSHHPSLHFVQTVSNSLPLFLR
jgi:predicted nucleic-acid-binding Zn-ribbon protein